MKQLTVISGKGGTGKTSLTAAFASLAKNAVIADCDVDAADLHLILKPKIKEMQEFTGLKIAQINENKCIKCQRCYESCRYNAIDENIKLDKSRCEGCGVCEHICPEDAIELVDRKSGIAYISDTRFGPMSHAKLNVAEEASGKLVALVRNNAQKLVKKYNRNLMIIDGPPGIGCPVIASITGVDLVLIVTEPTMSGINDLERVIGVINHFNIPVIVCINKWDINIKNTKKVESYCKKNGIDILGKIPYDNIITQAMIHEKTIIEFSKSEVSEVIKKCWMDIQIRLNNYVIY